MDEKTINQMNTSQFLPPGRSCQRKLLACLLVLLSSQDPLGLHDPKAVEGPLPRRVTDTTALRVLPSVALQGRQTLGGGGTRGRLCNPEYDKAESMKHWLSPAALIIIFIALKQSGPAS